MPNGDAAAAAGMDIVAGTDPRSLGYDEINLTRDYVANYAKRSAPAIDIFVGTTDPGHNPGRIWIRPV